jgi:hypothetical protein
MMKYLLFLLFLSFHINLFSQQQYQHWQWAKSFGGSGNDSTVDMKIKNGFLYVTGTFTSPQINWDGTILTNHGGQDIFVAKLDTLGNTVWVKNFGGGGDDAVLQLEINSNGQFVLRCTSTSNAIAIGSSTFSNPDNFFMMLNINGDVLNTVVLPEGPMYNDVDLDNGSGVYICGKYQHSFIFNGAAIDSSYGLAGAILLKYNGSMPAWYKNVQVRINQRYEIYDYDIDPYGPITSPLVGYTAPITGTASASMQIEYNEQDSVLGIVGQTVHEAYLDGNRISYDPYQFDRSFIYGFKIPGNGIISPANFHNNWSSFAGNSSDEFKTGLSGYSYTTSRFSALTGYHDYTITVEKNNRHVSSLSRGDGYIGSPTVPAPTAWSPFETDESGNYLLCTEMPSTYWRLEPDKRNVVILDTNLNTIKKTFVPEINRLSLNVRAMADTHAIFFGSTFSDGLLSINENLPGNEINLSSKGQSEIFIGKYICDGFSLPQLTYPHKTSYKTCNTTDSIQLYLNVADSFGAAPYTVHWQASSYFSDTTILNPKVYFGGDSIVNRLTITDANGMKFSKDFVFFSGKPSDLRLVVNNTNICSNDSVILSLDGIDFQQCEVAGIPWFYNQANDARIFTSIGKQIKYAASYSHTVYLVPDYDKEYLTPSAYCINEVPININVRTAFTDTKNIYVCPGSDYTFADSITVHNIQNPFTHIIHFTNMTGCDSNYVINVMIATLYSKTKTRNICSGMDYYFPDHTVLRNITKDTLYSCHFASVYSCDSIINYNLHVNPVTTTIIDAPVCRGGSYVLHYINYTDTIKNITSDSTYTIHLYSQRSCDSILKIQVRAVSQFDVVENTSLCPGSSYTFPDGHVINNITTNINYTSRLTAIGGCDSIITTNITVNPVYNFTENANVCSGSNFTFPDGTIINNISGNISHSSLLHSVYGCDSIIITNISLITIDTSVTKNILALKSNSNFSSYQWIDCIAGTSISSATSQTYTASSVGSYAVEVSKEGCTDTSSCYIITEADILAGGRQLISVYPVPSTDHYTLVVQSERQATLNIALLNFTGTQISQQNVQLLFGKNIITKNISSLTSGTYTLVLRRSDNNETVTKMIIKL